MSNLVAGLSNPFRKELFFHLLGWLVFFGLLVAVFAWPYPNPFPVLRITLVMLALIGFYYTNTLLLIPKLLASKKIALYIAAVLACIFVVISWDLWIQRTLNTEFYHNNDWYTGAIIQRATLLSLLVLAVSGGLKMTKEWFRTERQKNQMEKEKMTSELALLKSQINPHSLFNNLNSIYSLAVKKSEDAPKAIVKLSEMMRYILYDSSVSQISLEQEIDHLQNYLDLQKLRMHREAKIQFEKSGDWQTKTIAPMLLEPFVENAFKHGNIHQPNAEILLDLVVEDDDLRFTVRNTIDQKSVQKDSYSGIGLANIQKRLNLVYPFRHAIQVKQTEEYYQVELSIELSMHD
ncbi:MAG: sensor histidine kinase [Cyclobacteriaceae bacterium]